MNRATRREADAPTRMQEIRQVLGFTQVETAKLAGIDQRRYCQIEAGQIEPTRGELRAVSMVLGVATRVMSDPAVSVNLKL